MRKYVFIAGGGFLGAIVRYVVKGFKIGQYNYNFPINTLIINITGSFILALILTAAYETKKFDEDIRLGISVGFLGAYTTFSTFCKETVGLINQEYFYLAFFYVVLSVMLGLAGVYFGVLFTHKVILVRARNK